MTIVAEYVIPAHLKRHPRAGGDPELKSMRVAWLDSRFRGNDGGKAGMTVEKRE